MRILSTSSSSSNSSADSASSVKSAAHIPFNTDYRQDETNEIDEILANFLSDNSSNDEEPQDFNIDDLISDSDDDTKKEKAVKKAKENENKENVNIIEINDDDDDDDDEKLQSKRRNSTWKYDKLLKDHIWTSSDDDSSDSNFEPTTSTSKRIKREFSIQQDGQQKSCNVGESTIITDSDDNSDDCRLYNYIIILLFTFFK